MAGMDGTQPMRIAVNTTTIESAPIFGAAELSKGRVELIGGKIPRLLDGSAIAATNAETQALLYSVANPGIRIILTAAECAYRIVARRSAGIRNGSDLRGRKVGTLRHTSAHFYLAKTLGRAGLSETDATVIDVPLGEMPAALARGDVDALAIWEPVAEAAAQALNDDVAIFEGPSLYRERFNLNTTADILRDPARRAVLVDFVRTVIDAAGRIRERPQDAWPLLSSQINVAETTIARLWAQFRFPATIPDDLLPLLVEEEQWLAAAQNREPRSPEALATLIDPSVLGEARARPRG